MELDVSIFQDEDGLYIAECPAIPGCVSKGKTEAEALENIEKAIIDCLEVHPETCLPSS